MATPKPRPAPAKLPKKTGKFMVPPFRGWAKEVFELYEEALNLSCDCGTTVEPYCRYCSATILGWAKQIIFRDQAKGVILLYENALKKRKCSCADFDDVCPYCKAIKKARDAGVKLVGEY